jgi:prepilin peptidase CpaA
MQPFVPWIAALLVCSVASVTDVRSGRIPNWLTIGAAVFGLGFHLVTAGLMGLLQSAVGLVSCALIPFVLHRATRGKAIGGGDVKLFAALGALTLALTGLEIELVSFAFLCVFAFVRLAYRGQLLRVLLNALMLAARPMLPRRWRREVAPEALTEMRLGPAIAVAAFVVIGQAGLGLWLPWLG